MNKLDNTTKAYGISASIVIIFSTILVMLKESFPIVHNALVALSGHHWISHGLIDVVLFFVLGTLLSKKDFTNVNIFKVIYFSVILGAVGIVGYFL